MPEFLVRETAVHFIDTFRFLMGEVRAVTARLRRLNPVIAGEDSGLLIFEFDDARTGLFDGNRLNGHPATHLRRTMGEAARNMEPFEEAYAKADWSRFDKLPLFRAANRINAYNTYLLMEQSAK